MQAMSPSEVAQFRASTRKAFGADTGTGPVRAAMDTTHGWEKADWRRLAQTLDLPGLMLPEEVGGAGMTAHEMAVIFEEAGRTLVVAPLLATCGLAVPYLLALGDTAAIELLGPSIASGDAVVSVVRPRHGSVIGVNRDDDGYRLHGTAHLVVDGATADALLVVADDASGTRGVFLVRDEFTAEPLMSLDLTRKLATVSFHDTPATRIGPVDAGDAISRAEAVTRCLLASEQVGGAQRCLDMAVDYAKTRIQFGRPIGSFQIIKQRLAEALVLVESARSAVHVAVRSSEPTESESRVAAISATHAFDYLSALNIQIHGGIGFTWEHDAHLYYKRARTSAALLDDENTHVETLAQFLDTEIA